MSPQMLSVLLLVFSAVGMAVERVAADAPRCDFPQRRITVDGNPADWDHVVPNRVEGREHLWYGQGMTPEKWQDNGDLSYQWRGAWSGNKLYFLFEVTDDCLREPDQPSSYLCDCIEIYLDYAHRGGQRVTVLDGRADWFTKCDPRELRGFELHFLPSESPRVYLDHASQYALDKPQTERFQREWNGEVVTQRTASGYLMEIGLSVPGLAPQAGHVLGVETGVCDDDGQGRESIQMWTGTKSDFWLSMDEYGEVTLSDQDVPREGPADTKSFGTLDSGAVVSVIKTPDDRWGLRVSGARTASVTQPAPVCIELSDRADEPVQSGYDSVGIVDGEAVGRARVTVASQLHIDVEDRWSVAGTVLRVTRTLRVTGNAPAGFVSGVTLPIDGALSWPQVSWFAPGMIYGGFDHLTDTAIGGKSCYRPGDFTVRIREDRLPAPLLAAYFQDGSSLAVLNPAPRGDTIAADAHDVTGETLVDERFQFGAIGAEEKAGGIRLGYWFPGTEGQVTYAGNTYPGGHLHQWRRRYHPLNEGLVQHYQVCFRFDSAHSFSNCYRSAWRWAWQSLDPQVTHHDIDEARHQIVDVLSACVVQCEGRTGIPNFIDTGSKDLQRADRKAILGFCGKCLEAARFLLREAVLDDTPRGRRLRQQAESIVESFLVLKIDPPIGEGFRLDSGEPACAIGDREVFLRSFGDDLKALLQAYQEEQRLGRDHPEWLAWCRRFGDWLLTQQQPGGGFPRTWKPGSGEVVSASPNSSYNAVPLLVLLAHCTSDRKYLAAAISAAEYCWQNGQSQGRFVGGTIDNPDVLDKEAATLSLEAYLALYTATAEERWIERAKAAADFAETWIYVWNVPMPADDQNPDIHWKHGVPTVGVQLISSGHSLVDAYMAFDTDEFARLYQITGDKHYLDVARLLLHNTKNMLALPGRTFDLTTPGWQQEHWSLAPRRGYGLHRGWLPWVATSQLNGIFGLMDLDGDLYHDLAGEPGGDR